MQRHRDTRGFYGDNALVKVVRLTIETNLMTSKYTPLALVRQPFLHPSASVGIVSLVLVVLYPVSNPQIAIDPGV